MTEHQTDDEQAHVERSGSHQQQRMTDFGKLLQTEVFSHQAVEVPEKCRPSVV